MAKVKNITAMELGWKGLKVAPGSEIEVDDLEATRMVEQNPQKFELAAGRSGPSDGARDLVGAPNRMMRSGRRR